MTDTTEAQKKEKKKKIKLGIAIAAAVVVLGVAIKLIFFRGQFLYAGTLEATKIDLSSRLSAAIATAAFEEGDHVKTNQVLVKLACENYYVDDEFATITYNRNLKLIKANTISQETMDQARFKKEDADVKVAWCTIQSPINGVILSKYHWPGEWMSPGTKILTMANIKDIWAYIYVPQPDVSKLKIGQKLKGILPEQNNRVFMGHILKINDEAEFTPKNVQTRAERTRLVYGVKVSFLGENDEEILKPGMTIEIELPH